MNVTKHTRKWYKNVKVPNTDSAFASFTAKFSGIINMISGVEVEVSSEMPYAATDGKKIYIPTTYFLDEFYELFGWPNGSQHIDNFMKLATINGSSIHEAMHVIRTGKYCEKDKFAALDKVAKQYFENHEAFGTLVNIVEDIHIEEYGRLFYQSVSKFLDDKNDILFPPFLLEEFELELTVSSIINFMSFFKNTKTIKSGDSRINDLEPYINKLMEARNPGLEIKERLQIAIDIWEMFANDDDVEKDEKAMQQPSSDGDDEKSQQQKKGEKNLKGTSSQSGNGNEDKIMKVFVEASEAADKQAKMKAIESSHNKQIEIESMNKFDKFTAETFGVDEFNVDYIDVMDSKFKRYATFSTELVISDDRFLKIGRFLRYARQQKTTPGRPRNIGTQVNRNQLHRIATDGKVLQFKDHRSMKKGKPQVVFLIDLSGSMRWNSMYARVLKASKGAFESLMRAGIPCAIYAHTTSEKTCLVYGISSFQMPLGQDGKIRTTTDFEARFNKAIQTDKRENADGFAINHVSKCFKSTPGTKILYVLSDGSPNAPGYRGRDADNHTSLSASIARENGIQTYSMSLVSDVVDDNNNIYGKEYNYDLSGENLDHVFREIVKSMQNI